jgi:subtilisin family serine protease
MKQRMPLEALFRAIILATCVGWLLAGTGAAVASEGSGGDAPLDAGMPVTTPKAPKKQSAKPVAKKPAAATSQRSAAPRKAAPVRVQRAVPAAPRETAESGLPPEGETRFVSDQVIVRYRIGARQSAMDALVRRLNLAHVAARTFALAGVTVHLYDIADGSGVRDVIAALQADPAVVYAQPNYLYTLLQSAAGASSGPQYALDKLVIGEAHKLATGDGVRIAVIDSQIDAAHAEFAKARIDMFDATGDAEGPAHTHGTSIAGVIASHGTLLGIAPNVRLLGIRAFLENKDNGSAFGTSWRIASGLDHANAAEARVVNMSFAGPEDPLVGDCVAGLVRRGVIGIAAAGNEGPAARPLYPAAYPGVIAVTAIDKDDAVYTQANQGAYVALAAPGVDILVPAPSNGYEVTSGTSLAAAHISGLVALMLSREPSLTPSDVAGILLSSSADLGQPGRDSVFGAGLPDALTAIKASARNK